MSTSPESTPATPTSWARLKRLVPHLKPARRHFAGGLVAGWIFAVATGAGLPMMMKTVIPIIFHNDEEAPAWLVEWARNFFGDQYHEKLLIYACIGIPILFLIRGVAAFTNRYLLAKAGFITIENLRIEVFTRLQGLPLAFYHRHKSGDLMARLTNDTEQLRQTIVRASGDIIKQPLTLVAAVGFLVYLSMTERSALFTLVAMMSVPLCVFPIRLVAKHLHKRSRQLAEATGDMTATLTESLQAPLEIQAYNLQQQQTARFATRIATIIRLSLKTSFYQSIPSPAIEVVSAAGFVAALYFGVKDGMTFATFTALAFALYVCYEPVKQLGYLHGFIKMCGASLERLEEILDAEDTVPQPAQPVALPTDKADIVLDHVGFTYQAREPDDVPTPALIDINVRFQPGEVVALVGESGAGKSTFVALLPRFYDTSSGRVTVGNVDVRTADKTALRDRIALVPQMPTLFNGTIADNIRVGRASATDDEVKVAAQKAFIADFIEGLPQGYATQVGERGASLSGGQRQRIAIARAFLKDAPILILDEATSALDSESEAKIQMALKQLVGGRTTFMIAHRFSSIGLATRILVFEKGRITGDGTPADLALTHPVYRRMCELQKL